MTFQNGSLYIRVVSSRGKGELRFDILADDLDEAAEAVLDEFGLNYRIISDGENWGGLTFLDLTTIGMAWELGKLANSLDESEAFLLWLNKHAPYQHDNTSTEILKEEFSASLVGVYDSYANYGWEMSEDLLQTFPGVEPFVDFEGYGRWLATDYTVTKLHDGRIVIFKDV